MKLAHITAAVCAALVLTHEAAATTVIAPTFEELADRAELVFVGQTDSARSEWRGAGANRAIVTLTDFRVEEVWKGAAGKKVTLQFLGGTVGDTTLDVAGMPRFTEGERVVLFVTKNGVQFCPLVGIHHGKFGLRKDPGTGRDIIVKHDGKPLRDVAEIGAGDQPMLRKSRSTNNAPVEALSLETFKARVRDHLNSGANAK